MMSDLLDKLEVRVLPRGLAVGRLVRVPNTRVVLGVNGPALRALEGPPRGPLVRRRAVGVVAGARPVPHVTRVLVLRVGHVGRVLELSMPHDVLVVVRGPVPRLGDVVGPPRPGVQVHEGHVVGGDRPRVPTVLVLAMSSSPCVSRGAGSFTRRS